MIVESFVRLTSVRVHSFMTLYLNTNEWTCLNFVALGSSFNQQESQNCGYQSKH